MNNTTGTLLKRKVMGGCKAWANTGQVLNIYVCYL